eukprot:8571410-Alexandrium_andersonii.AAC.1
MPKRARGDEGEVAPNGGCDVGATPLNAGRDLATVRLLARSKAPRVLMKLLVLLMMSNIPSPNITDGLEYFAGEQGISKASTRRGRLAVPYDARLDLEADDWMTAKGWLVALAPSLA